MQPSVSELDRWFIESAAERLVAATPEGSEVLLFGSYARGDARPGSDLDFFVVEPEPVDRHGEMVRLREVLRDSPVAVDVVVVGRSRFESWRLRPGTIDSIADREGRRYARGA